MYVEQFPNFFEWIGSGLLQFGLILLSATILGVFFGYIIASFRHGPFEAFYVVAQVIAEARHRKDLCETRQTPINRPAPTRQLNKCVN